MSIDIRDAGLQGEGKEGMINLIIAFTAVQQPAVQQQPAGSLPSLHVSSVVAVVAGPLYTEEELMEMQAMFPAIDIEVRCGNGSTGHRE
jgi:hypothetical protein